MQVWSASQPWDDDDERFTCFECGKTGVWARCGLCNERLCHADESAALVGVLSGELGHICLAVHLHNHHDDETVDRFVKEIWPQLMKGE